MAGAETALFLKGTGKDQMAEFVTSGDAETLMVRFFPAEFLEVAFLLEPPFLVAQQDVVAAFAAHLALACHLYVPPQHKGAEAAEQAGEGVQFTHGLALKLPDPFEDGDFHDGPDFIEPSL